MISLIRRSFWRYHYFALRARTAVEARLAFRSIIRAAASLLKNPFVIALSLPSHATIPILYRVSAKGKFIFVDIAHLKTNIFIHYDNNKRYFPYKIKTEDESCQTARIKCCNQSMHYNKRDKIYCGGEVFLSLNGFHFL